MLSSRQFDPAAPRGSAALARHRLLTDRTMRQAQSHRAVPVAACARSRAPLSPAEQRELIQAVARGFDTLYLARTTYLKDSGLTVATLLPCAAHQGHPQRISVDTAGNVSVSAWTPTPSPSRPSSTVRRMTLSLMGVVAILSVVALSL